MDRESVERLRFDRRLHSRRGWVEDAELSSHLESLEDVSSKMTTAAELESEESSAGPKHSGGRDSSAGELEAPTSPSAGFSSGESTEAPPSGGVAGEFTSSARNTLGGDAFVGGFGGRSDGSADS